MFFYKKEETMISDFGKVLKDLRAKNNDTLKTLSEKLEISLPYLSAMEVGRRVVPMEVVGKIKEIYNLSSEDYNLLYSKAIETNQHVDLELSKMNEAQKEVSMVFARRIENADPVLLEKLKKVLEEE